MKIFDSIIIGSGISGLNFALRTAEKGNRVLIVTKKKIAASNTNFAQGGIAAVLSKLDKHKKHVSDTMKAGSYHNNKKAVFYMVRNGPASINRLIELGVKFATHQGKLLLAREGGHSMRRIAFVSDYTGRAIEKILVAEVKKHPLITLKEHAFAADLLVKNKTCYGVQIIKNNRFENLYGRIIVLATGGAGQIFENTTNPEIATGDGIGMAYRAGCLLRDMEFMQFHPTALKSPRNKPQPRKQFLISEAVRGEGAYLLNSKGERFMLKRHRLTELAPRDIVSRAIFEQEKNGPVYLDIRRKNSSFIKTRFPQIYKTLKSCGIDMTKDLIPVSTAAHYLCGGVRVNLKGETRIKNLYAFGEVAGTGVHGANRLASNSLLEALVFSDRAPELPRMQSRKFPKFPLKKYQKIKTAEKRKISRIKKNLKRAMWKNAGVYRSEKSLNQALKTVKKLEKDLSNISKKNQETIEFLNMLETSGLIIKSAQKRKKSLGCHFIKSL